MSLGAALLRPQVVRRTSPDAIAALVEDVSRLAALVIEDAADGGPLAAEAQAAAEIVGTTLAASVQPRRAAAETRLRSRIAPMRGFVEGLRGDVTAVTGDPAAILSLVRKLLGFGRTAAQAATLPVLRQELAFWRALVEEDLGLAPAFLGQTVAAFLAEWARRLADVPAPADPGLRRRLRLARAVLERLVLRADLLVPPALDTEPLARLLHDLLSRGGIAAALREVDCALAGVEASLDAALAAGRVAASASIEERGAVPLADAAEYSYYASWLLADEDVPLLGLSDLDDPRGFLDQLRTGTKPVERHLRDEVFTAPEKAILASATTDEPGRDELLAILAAVNRAMQAGPMLDFGTLDDFDTAYGLTDEIRDLRGSHAEDQALFLFNRRVVEQVFAGKVDGFAQGFFHALWRDLVNPALVRYPRNQVFVTGDRRYVMCDDIPLVSGENLEWHHAPMFAGQRIRHGMWFRFDNVTAGFCEGWAQVFTLLGECGKAIWHLVETQPGHEAQAATVGSIELADTVQQILFGKPPSAYFLQKGPHLRRWGKSLDSSVGLKGIATFASTFQGLQSEAPSEKFWFWVTVLMGDVFRTTGPIMTVNTLRDLFIGFVALWSFGGPRDGPSTLPADPARNHLKQGPYVGASDALFAILLISLYPRDNYSIFIWSEDGIADRRKEAMAGHWLGGSAGLGLLAGLTGSFVAQVIAWSEDVPRFFKTGAISAGKMFGLYWLYNYSFKENRTDDGRYRPGGGEFAGYPDKDRAASPYLLPFAGGRAEYTGQANLGLFSHNFITNSDFVTPANSATQQAYAYDFGHDFRTPIACARSGVVWSLVENMADGSTGPWNVLIIRHDTIDPVHDRFARFGNAAVQTYAVYGHLAQNGVTTAPRFGGTSPVQESVTPGGGTPVAQGDLIALAGDTGMSFHNHLHMHVLPDDGTGRPNLSFAIPFVFQDAPGDGVLKSTTWYRSGNR